MSVAVVSWLEYWAERQHRKRQAAAAAELERRQADEKRRQEEQQQRDREAEKLRRLHTAGAAGSKALSAGGLRQRGGGGSRPRLESMLSWQSEMLARIDKEEELPPSGNGRQPAGAAEPQWGGNSGGGNGADMPPLSRRSAGDWPERTDSALPPPSPGAAGGKGGGAGEGTPRPGAKGGAAGEGAAASGGGGIWGLVSGLDLSYLAEHVQVSWEWLGRTTWHDEHHWTWHAVHHWFSPAVQSCTACAVRCSAPTVPWTPASRCFCLPLLNWLTNLPHCGAAPAFSLFFLFLPRRPSCGSASPQAS